MVSTDISEIASACSVANFELSYFASNLFYYTNAFMTKGNTMGNEVDISAAERCVGDFEKDFFGTQGSWKLGGDFLDSPFDAAIDVVREKSHGIYYKVSGRGSRIYNFMV